MNEFPQYKQPNVSAENQPRILTPLEIPRGYKQLESGLLVNIGVAGNIAAKVAKKPWTIADAQRAAGIVTGDMTPYK